MFQMGIKHVFLLKVINYLIRNIAVVSLYATFFDTFAFVGLNSTFSTVYQKLSKGNETGLILLCVL